MSELKIQEFRERAEHGVAVPDLATIERRGRSLRRTRMATLAAALALVLAGGYAITQLDSGDRGAAPTPIAPPPSPSPSAPSQAGVRTTLNLGEDVLRPGPSEASYDGVTVRFAVTSPNWEWWETGLGLRRTPKTRNDYGVAVFFLQNPFARLGSCAQRHVRPLGADADDLIGNVAPLLHLAHSRVLQRPRVVQAFGQTAVHVRLETDDSCPDRSDVPEQLEGVFDGSSVEPAWPGRHRLDAWHIVVPGSPSSMLVVSWDLDGTAAHHAQEKALRDSLRITAG